MESVFITVISDVVYYDKQKKYVMEKEVKNMNEIGKGMLVILIILYIVSPIDFAPGPVDDAIALLLGLAAAKRLD